MVSRGKGPHSATFTILGAQHAPFGHRHLDANGGPFLWEVILIPTVSGGQVGGGTWGSKGSQSPSCWQLWSGRNPVTFTVLEGSTPLSAVGACSEVDKVFKFCISL